MRKSLAGHLSAGLMHAIRSLPSLRPLAALAGIFTVNVYVCWRLFFVDFTERMEAIESSYMSIARWAMDNWGDLTWFPLWFTGNPFHKVYQPGLHLSVAGLATVLGWSPQHAYHFLTALAYCLSGVTLFWLIWRVSGRLAWAGASALIFSLLSPTAFLVAGIRHDMGGYLLARRFQILVHYGEGPHTTAVMLIPLVIWFIHAAATERRWPYTIPAVLGLSALALTNWPGTMGFAMVLLAYVLSRLNAQPKLHWPTLMLIGGAAYLVAAPWMPPSVISAVLRNAQQSDATYVGLWHLLRYSLLALALAGLHLAFRRLRTYEWLRFFAYATLVTGAVSIGREWFGWRLMPQPNRVQVEFEMAAAGLLGFAVVWSLGRAPDRLRTVCITLLAVAGLSQAVTYRKYAHSLIRPIDITQTIEYRMAKWFDANLPGRRVFAPGNVSLWMNMFTDVPQVAGCCDQGIPTQEHRIAVYVIYTGQNAGERDVPVSLMWLKAYGADAIGITGPNSTEVFKPYWNPWKFAGRLPELWRSGDNAVFEVPRRVRSLAHVIPRAAVVTVPPENGLITGPLEPLVAALDDPAYPAATFRWINNHEAVIDATVASGQSVFVQVTYDAGWNATIGGAGCAISSDALGLMVIDPARTGPVRIRLIYDGGAERNAVRAASAAGWAMILCWTLLARRRAARANRGARSL